MKSLYPIVFLFLLASCEEPPEKIMMGTCENMQPNMIYKAVIDTLDPLYTNNDKVESISAYKKAHLALSQIKTKSLECHKYHSSAPTKKGVPHTEIKRHMEAGDKYLDMSLLLSWLVLDIEHNSTMSSNFVGQTEGWRAMYKNFIEKFKDA